MFTFLICSGHLQARREEVKPCKYPSLTDLSIYVPRIFVNLRNFQIALCSLEIAEIVQHSRAVSNANHHHAPTRIV